MADPRGPFIPADVCIEVWAPPTAAELAAAAEAEAEAAQAAADADAAAVRLVDALVPQLGDEADALRRIRQGCDDTEEWEKLQGVLRGTPAAAATLATWLAPGPAPGARPRACDPRDVSNAAKRRLRQLEVAAATAAAGSRHSSRASSGKRRITDDDATDE